MRQTDRFGRAFEPQNGSYHVEAGRVQEEQLNSNAAHSESSESERISALHGNIHSRPLPDDTPGLQQYLADLQGEVGRLTKVQDVVSAILQDRSEVKRLSEELQQEKERAKAAEELHRSRLLQVESNCRAEAAKARQLQEEVTELQERERDMQHALSEAQRHVQDRESVLAHWKEERQAADAEAKLAAEAAAHRHEDELRAAQAEISALRQTAAERKPAEEKRHAEMLEAIERWRVLVSEKEEEIRGLQQQMGHLQSQAWHYQSEIQQMDAHYRHELDSLVAAKAAADAEVLKLREEAAAPAQAHAENGTTPTPTSRSAPTKGIKNGSMVDATQRSVAPELHQIMNGGIAHATPHDAPELLSEQQLVDALLEIVPRGEAHAKKFSHVDYQRLEAALGGRRWDHLYQPKYGSVAEFMRTHPEAFYQSPNGAFYRPDAPARTPAVQAATSQHLGAPTASAAGGPSTALIIPQGTANPPVVPKRPAVISAIVTPAAPANTRPKRAANSSNSSSISANAEMKQQPKAQQQHQQQQPQQKQQEHLSQAVAVPSDVEPGARRPPKALEKGVAAAALQQEQQPRRSDARKLEQANGGASLSQPRGYLQAAKNAAPASAPKQTSVEDFPALHGSKDRQKEAPVQEEKHALSVPPGLHGQNSAAEQQSGAKEATAGSSRTSVEGGKSERGDGEGKGSSGKPTAGNGPASDTASAGGADKEKSRKKRNRKKGASGAGLVGAP
ncbi:probable reticulocyte-binding protein 2 homolog a at N-terminal half [Coccomyxa sp. Obi]|nr:probable reticulocyte-binding protein 2 homolog a at N-terminal half [Coccomyxa sp. Obi]